ncbi:MAG: metal-sensitive transcriptional regulator [Spirochaetia bacterium]|nr:metal-sensitive transcriptional regulator [Spirochaetota bacterium]MCX8096770.1 metal-sensitive transcriptional regulator [Spirochaetota bacterium]MDW8112544.1 metal-sensitive transcriptional regulator [Spirochaetia bacterium]
MNDETKKNIIFRLNRVKGQIDGIIRMIEDNDDCQLIFQQIKAAYSALRSAGKMIIIDDVGKCIGTGDEKRLKKLLEKMLEE